MILHSIAQDLVLGNFVKVCCDFCNSHSPEAIFHLESTLQIFQMSVES